VTEMRTLKQEIEDGLVAFNVEVIKDHFEEIPLEVLHALLGFQVWLIELVEEFQGLSEKVIE